MYKDLFDVLDKSNDGVVSREELQEAYTSLCGKGYIGEKTNAVFKSLDLNKNGMLDFTEFCIAVMDLPRKLTDEKIFATFTHFDEGKGFITHG